ncbi:MAG TPA: hypothetical protein VHW66_08285 [Stellaceae bacterium]|jgi:hypothetical protein|nr:hypothetical protein [Stellaceae bacterium]
MSSRLARRHSKTTLGLVVFALASMQTAADAELAQPSHTALESTVHFSPPQIASQDKACQAGLRFGIEADQIPLECGAYPVLTLTTGNVIREKWRYRRGYLFFYNGILKAIRQVDL